MNRKIVRLAIFALAVGWSLPALAQTCPTSGDGITCFGGQAYCSANKQCYTPPASCPSNMVMSCGSCGCTCPGGTSWCSSRSLCITNQTCPPGLTWDVCTETCSTPFVLLNPPTTQIGGANVSSDIRTGGDLYLPSGKAIRVDADNAMTELNIGNWGAGEFGFTLGVSGDIYANRLTTTNGVSSPSYCIGASCISSWPTSGVGGSGVANTVPKWTSASALGNSNITDDGTTVTVTGTLKADRNSGSATNYGVDAIGHFGTNNYGVHAIGTGGSKNYGIWGQGSSASGSGYGLYGIGGGAYGYGAYAESTATNTSYGVYAKANGTGTSYALYGEAVGPSTNWGLYVNAGNSYFGGRVGIGVSPNASRMLDITSSTASMTGVYASVSGSDSIGGNFATSGAGTSYGLKVSNSAASGLIQRAIRVDATAMAEDNFGVDTNASGATTRNYGLKSNATGAAVTNYAAWLSASGGTNNWGLYVNAGNSYMNGDVGIGITPAARLHVYKTGADANLSVQTTTTASTADQAQLDLKSGNGYTRLFYRDDSGDFGIYHGIDGTNATKLRIDGSADFTLLMEGGGDVGIGTTAAPPAQLSLGGDASGYAGTTDGTQLWLGGASNSGTNTSSAGSSYKLLIDNYDNDGSSVYPIYVRDENDQVDFSLKNRQSASGLSQAYFQGNVGIGVESPTSRLDVAGSGVFSGFVQADGVLSLFDVQVDGNVYASNTVVGTHPSYGSGYAALWKNAADYAILASDASTYVNAPTGNVYFRIGNSNKMTLDSTGEFGIGTTPTYKLHVVAAGAPAAAFVRTASDGTTLWVEDTDGSCQGNPESGSLVWTCSSDVRLKTDITDTGDVLGRLADIRIRDYTVKASGERRTGVIAQEIRETWPELVNKGEDGYLAVAPPSEWYIIRGIQELAEAMDSTLKLDADGGATVASLTVAGDIEAPDNKWGGSEERLTCEEGETCLCDDGWYMVGVASTEPLTVICRQL